jgi:sugar phosphate isomerase/epimerase
MVPGETLLAKAALLRSWGFDAISVFWPYDRWDDAVHEELRTLKERVGITPCEFVFMAPTYGRLMDSDSGLRAACREMYRRAADVCAELGLVTELEFEYGVRDPLPLFDPYQQLSPEQSRAFCAVYVELADVLRGSGGQVLLEPLNRYESRYLNSVGDCLDVLAAIDHPQAGLLFDFFHVSIEEPSITEAIRRAGARIKHVHLADSNRLPPGRGNIDWAACFAALREAGFDGYVNLECASGGDPAQTLPETARFLRRLMNEGQG